MPSDGITIHDCPLPAQPKDPTEARNVRCTGCNWGWRWNPIVHEWFRADPGRNAPGGPIEEYIIERDDAEAAAVVA